jgi:hypothetical protein
MIKYIALLVLLVSAAPLFAQHDVPPTAEFKVTGAVKKEMKYTTSDILRFSQDSLGDVVIRNHRGEPKGVAKQLKGILLKNLLDSAGIVADKPKDYSELVITLIASDDYRNVYSWNELFNTDIGNHVYIVTTMDGKSMDQMTDRILVLSLADINLGRRHLKGLARIEIKKVL